MDAHVHVYRYTVQATTGYSLCETERGEKEEERAPCTPDTIPPPAYKCTRLEGRWTFFDQSNLVEDG